MSRAFSVPKADRNYNVADKVNKGMKAVGPGSYQMNLNDKKKEPVFSMGAKLENNPHKFSSPSPDKYTIPSKLVESPGKTMGEKTKILKNSTIDVPGPGTYSQEKSHTNLKYSMALKLNEESKLKLMVPGPGTYEKQE
jgi:hypothetical protein